MMFIVYFLMHLKLYDRVKYSKLSHCLLDRKLPAVFLDYYLAYIQVTSPVFYGMELFLSVPIKTGAKQGVYSVRCYSVSNVYIDGLLNRLAKCHAGCYTGLTFLCALAHANDIVLLAPTPSAIRKLLNICDDYASEYSITFNGKKSKCIFYPGSKEVGNTSVRPLSVKRPYLYKL